MDDIARDIEKAFQLWSSVTPLTFRRRFSGDTDINISFGAKDHGDKFPFDGPGGVAAHAFPPIGNDYDGVLHVDDDELFTRNDGKYGRSIIGGVDRI